MINNQILGKTLLWLHLIVCCIWLAFFHGAFTDPEGPPTWAVHVFFLSILAVQFTWGFTVGLNVGPSRKKRDNLWWSLLTVFLPMWFYNMIVKLMALFGQPLWAILYLAAFIIILASETYCGVLLGVKMHAESKDED